LYPEKTAASIPKPPKTSEVQRNFQIFQTAFPCFRGLKSRLVRFSIFTAFLINSKSVLAQIIEPLGQTPSHLKWNELNTQHFRVLFPDGMLIQAERTANALENAYADVAQQLGLFSPGEGACH